jgi:hypothetical protein
MRFEVFKAVTVKVIAFWDVTPCRFVDRHRYFLEENAAFIVRM